MEMICSNVVEVVFEDRTPPPEVFVFFDCGWYTMRTAGSTPSEQVKLSWGLTC